MVPARRPALWAVACAGMTWWALLRPSAAVAAPSVVINEALYDAVGADTGQEWIELFNAGEAEVDLSRWRIERGGTSFTLAFTFPDGARIGPGAFLLVGETAVAGAAYSGNLVFQNGGSATDGIRLVDGEGAVVDVLHYDEPNTSGLPDEGGSAGTSFAPDASEGQSLARRSDGADTNASGGDFIVAQTPTPGASNSSASSSPTPTASAAAGVNPQGVVVNEALPDPVGADAEGEFIELYNPTAGTIALGGAQLDDGEGGSTPYPIPSGTSIAPGAYRVFSRADTKLALNNEGDAVRLLASDGAGVASLTYPKSPREGVSWALRSDGSGEWTATVTRGAANVFSPLGDDDAGGSTTPTPTAKSSGASPTPAAARTSASSKGKVSGTAAKSTQSPAAPGGSAQTTAPVRPAGITTLPAADPPPAVRAGEDENLEPEGSPAPSPSPAAEPSANPPRRIPASTVVAWAVAGALGLLSLARARRRKTPDEIARREETQDNPDVHS